MNGYRQDDGRLDWLLTDFARSTPGVVHALVVSSDGLRLRRRQIGRAHV